MFEYCLLFITTCFLRSPWFENIFAAGIKQILFDIVKRLPQNMNDKPHLLAADTSKRSQPLEICPESIRKRRSISVKEKLDILNMVDSGCKVTAVARKFGISSSTASTILKERHKIKLLSDHYNIDPDRKRMRLGIYRDVDEAVHIWFRQMRMKHINVSGPMLQQKAREFAQQLGHPHFEGSSGWLFRFRERHGLCGKNKKEMEDVTNGCTGIGMTDDEIVSSVSQNVVHALTFSEKDKNCSKQDIPENYLVPKIELIDSEPNPELPDNQELAFDNNETIVPSNENESPEDYRNCGPAVIYNNSEWSEYHNTEPSVLYNNSPYEFADTAMESNEGSSLTVQSAISFANKLRSFLKHHNVPENVLQSMINVKNYIEVDLREEMKQRKITDFFKP